MFQLQRISEIKQPRKNTLNFFWKKKYADESCFCDKKPLLF